MGVREKIQEIVANIDKFKRKDDLIFIYKDIRIVLVQTCKNEDYAVLTILNNIIKISNYESGFLFEAFWGKRLDMSYLLEDISFKEGE